MASKKKISQKQVNKESAKKIRATAKNLKAVSKAIAKGIPKTRKTTKAKPTAKQIKATAKSAKKLVKVFRDVLGRFTKVPSAKSKPRQTVTQKPSSSKRQPKKEQTKPRVSAKGVSQTETKRKRLSTPKASKARSKPKTSSQKPPKKQPTKKPTPKVSKKASKKLFSISHIRAREGETTLEYFTRLRESEDTIDARLKSKGARFAFNYGESGRSRKLWPSLKLALDQLEKYDLTKQLYGGDESYPGQDQDLAKSVTFYTMKQGYKDYSDMREEQIRMRKLETRKIRRDAQKVLGESEKPDFGSADLLKRMTEQNIALKQRVEQLEGKKDESTTKRVSKAGAKVKSGSTKKGATVPKRRKSAKKQTAKNKGNKRK